MLMNHQSKVEGGIYPPLERRTEERMTLLEFRKFSWASPALAQGTLVNPTHQYSYV